MRHKVYTFAYYWFILLFFQGCSENIPEKRKWIIGFSQCTTDDDWRKTMNEEMRREVGFYRNLNPELIIKNAKNDNRKQIQDIQDLMKNKIDILIVSPNEATPLTPIVEEVYKKGIPVVIIDRKINSELFTAFIGADNFEIGKEVGKAAISLLKNKGAVLEITGLKGSTPAIERSAGFRTALQGSKITIVESREGKWLPDIAQKESEKALQNQHPDLIFAHNDPMALGAWKASLKAGQKPFIFGIDGLSVKNGGLENVLNGKITHTFLYPTGGDRAIQLAAAIYTHRPFKRLTTLNTITVTPETARTLLLQGEEIKEQQSKIDNQTSLISELTYRISRQSLSLLLAGILIALMAVIAGLLFYFYWKKDTVNKALDIRNTTIVQQNKKITEQRDHLIEMLKIAEERYKSPELLSSSLSNNNNPLQAEENHKRKTNFSLFHEKLVLIVESNDELRKTLSLVLKKHFNVYSAKDGKEGLQLSRSAQPDLILSDILLPVIDGFEMCKEIKKHPLTFHIPVILLSSLEKNELVVKGLDIGVDAYLSKPVDENILISQIKNLIASRENLYNTFGTPLFPLKNIKTTQKEEKEFIEKCVEIIYAYASEEDFTMDTLAHHLALSRSSLYRKIKEITEMKGVDFIKKIKLQYAANLLMNTNATVSEVAWQSGFSDVKYFSKCFSVEFGILPSRFKESEKNKE
jgi:ABC-type sugar transport system substrate-binding protein/DNA-binding response OmpR family regulator